MNCLLLALTFLTITMDKQVECQQGPFYCYEAVRDRNRPMATNDCPPPLVYQPTVQLCCGTQQLQGATVQQTFQQIPQAGSPEAIPEGCERGLSFPNGVTRCRTGLVQRTVGRNQLCCGPNVQVPSTAPAGGPGSVRPGGGLLTPGGRAILFTGGPGAALSACIDLAAPGRASDCPARRELCDNELYKDLMTQQCPQTCNRCSVRGALGAQFANAAYGGACVDRVGPNGRSDCAERVAYCRVAAYRTLMQQECPFTCNFCNPIGINGPAVRIVQPPILPGGAIGGINTPPSLQITNPPTLPSTLPPPPPPAPAPTPTNAGGT